MKDKTKNRIGFIILFLFSIVWMIVYIKFLTSNLILINIIGIFGTIVGLIAFIISLRWLMQELFIFSSFF